MERISYKIVNKNVHVLLWFFTKIRYLEHSREEDVKIVPKQEIIELKAQEA